MYFYASLNAPIIVYMTLEGFENSLQSNGQPIGKIELLFK